MTVDEAMNLALSHHQAGRLAEAEGIYRQILAVVPDHPGALHLLGVLAHQVGQSVVAVDLIRRSIQFAPGDAAAHSNLGEALRESGRLDEAVAAYRQAISLDPGMASAHSNLGLALHNLRRFGEAETALRRAIALDANSAAAWQNLCNTLGDLGKTAEAVDAGRRAVDLAPHAPSAWSDLAVAYVEHGDPRAACDAFDRSLAIDPSRPDTHHNLAQALLRVGDFERGWEEYEYRWQCRDFPSPVRNFPRPQWGGEPLAGRTILLHAEQGLGDTLMFARFIPLVAARGGRVVVECQPEILPLVRTAAPDVQYIPRGDALPDFDVHCPLLSLPRAFRTRLDMVPATVPYLHADPAKVSAWRDRLYGSAGLKVGIVWAGRPTHKNDHNRSVARERFVALATEGVTLHSLQVGPTASQAGHPPAGMSLVNLSPDLQDYSDTAAAIEALDLVIAVDTSVVHAAGALGREVWVLLPFAGDWRWILGRNDSPWYPTMRLFRQERPGDWDGVFARVAGELRRRASR